MAVRLEFPRNISIHRIVHVEPTTPTCTQQSGIADPIPPPSRPFIDKHGDTFIKIEKLFAHRRLGRGFHFFALSNDTLHHEVEWQQLFDFINGDGTITPVLHCSIFANDLLHLH